MPSLGPLGHAVRADYRIVRPDGSVRWITSWGRLQPGRSGESERLMGVSIYMTDSKRVEEELRQLKERLQAESDYLRDFACRFACWARGAGNQLR